MYTNTIIPILLLSVIWSACAQHKNVSIQGAATGQQTNKPRHSNDSIPAPIGFVNDYEGLFSVPQENALDSLLSAFENETTIEIVVVTLDSTIVSRENFDDFTLTLGNTWGVGKRNKNNGMLIGLSSGMRHIRIHNGYGIEPILSDSLTGAIIRDYFVPEYRKGNYFAGTWMGVIKIIEHLKD